MNAESLSEGGANGLPEGLPEGLSKGFALVRLTAADLSAVAALEAAYGWPTLGSVAQLAATLRDEASALFGLMADETLAGHALVVRLPFEAELQAILVDNAWRGQGLARRLLAGVVVQARVWGSERLLLEVRAGNAAAIALYRGASFREDGVRRGYYPPRQAGAVSGNAREDALLMSLPLVVKEAPGG